MGEATLCEGFGLGTLVCTRARGHEGACGLYVKEARCPKHGAIKLPAALWYRATDGTRRCPNDLCDRPLMLIPPREALTAPASQPEEK